MLLLLYSVSTGALAQAVNQKSTVRTKAVQKSSQLPIIDMHMHAVKANAYGPPPITFCLPVTGLPVMQQTRPYVQDFLEHLNNGPCTIKVISPATDEEVLRRTLLPMKKYNMYGVVSGAETVTWKNADTTRFIPGLSFNAGTVKYSPDSLRKIFSKQFYKLLGEVSNQYLGIVPTDSVFGQYLSVAEQLDIPVAIHMGPGAYGAAYLQNPKIRARDHNPLLLEEVLLKYPKLRIYIMHAGWPMIDELISLMYQHPQVYVDVAVINWVLPKKEFHRYLQRIVEAGFGKRVMFGSDQMVWPEAIEVAIQSVQTAAFLTEQQKRDIFYNNAARFLRFSKEEIDRHHGTEIKK